MMTTLSIFLLAALLGEIGCLAISWIAQCLRMRGVGIKSILAACSLSLPVWIGIFIWAGAQVNLPWQYILALVVWLGVSFGLMAGTRFSPGLQSVSEGMGLRFIFAAAFAVLVDLFVFGTVYSSSTMLTIGLLFSGGVLIHFHRFPLELRPSKLVKLQYKIAFAVGVALAEICGFALFKHGASLQSDLVVHTAMFQGLLSLLFLIVGGCAMLNDKKTGYMSVCYALGLAVLAVVAGMANGFAIAGLPIALFIMFSLIRAAFAATQDMKAETAGINPVTVAGILLVAAGIASTGLIVGL